MKLLVCDDAVQYQLLIQTVDTSEQAECEIAAVDLMVEKFVDGFLITPLQYDNKHLVRLHKEGRVPFVLTNRAIDELADVDTVLHNNYASAYARRQREVARRTHA